jgi:hypothetical protein
MRLACHLNAMGPAQYMICSRGNRNEMNGKSRLGSLLTRPKYMTYAGALAKTSGIIHYLEVASRSGVFYEGVAL